MRSLEAAASVAATAVAEEDPEASTQPSQAAEVAPQTSSSEPEAASSAPDSDAADGVHEPPPDGTATEQRENIASQPGARSEGEPDTAATPSESEDAAAQATAAGGTTADVKQASAPSAAPERLEVKPTDEAEEQVEGSGLLEAAEAGKGDAGWGEGDAEGVGAGVRGLDLTGSAGIADEEQLLPALMRQVTPSCPHVPFDGDLRNCASSLCPHPPKPLSRVQRHC